MIGRAGFLLLAAIVPPGAAAGSEPEEAPLTVLDHRLDSAWRNLNEAGSHICNSIDAQRQFAPVWIRFTQAMDDAERVLKRRPTTNIYVNSCLRRPDYRRFGRVLDAAERDLMQAERLLAAPPR